MVSKDTLNTYKAAFARFMSFIHGRPDNDMYPPDFVHSVEVLAAVTPADVVRYMTFKAFGTEIPAPDADPISARRSATLGFDKKAISFFMPNREKWSETKTEGNPTQAAAVHALLKRVRNKEAQKQGAKSKTKRTILRETVPNVDGVGGGGGVVVGQPGTNLSISSQLMGLQSCLFSMRQEILEVKNAIHMLNASTERNFQMIHRNMRRIAMQPVGMAQHVAAAAAVGTVGLQQQQQKVPAAAAAAAGDPNMMPATLMPTPRSLHDLWEEYQHGVGGRKAAKLFSSSERGRVKHKYHRRNVIWNLVAGLVKQGHTAEAAIDRIYAVYGEQTSVTSIVNGLTRDRKKGTLDPKLKI